MKTLKERMLLAAVPFVLLFIVLLLGLAGASSERTVEARTSSQEVSVEAETQQDGEQAEASDAAKEAKEMTTQQGESEEAKETFALQAEEDGNFAAGAGVDVFFNPFSTPQTSAEDTLLEEAEEEPAQEEPQSDLAMADVKNVLNVRSEPDAEAKIVGYLYADCGGTILERGDGWTKLQSGELVGWASNDYLLFNEEAEELAQDVGMTVATTTTNALRIRKAPSLDAGVYDLLEEGVCYEVLTAEELEFSDNIQISDEWIAIDYDGYSGFVSAEFVKIDFHIDSGETLEQAEERKKKEAEEKRKREIEKLAATNADDLTLLAALIQCEAGNQPYEGQVAVGAVVMNRVLSLAYPNTIRDVIFASGQFTPVGSGKVGALIDSGNIRSVSFSAAQDAMAGVNPVGGATHFRRAGSKQGQIIGNHVFW